MTNLSRNQSELRSSFIFIFILFFPLFFFFRFVIRLPKTPLTLDSFTTLHDSFNSKRRKFPYGSSRYWPPLQSNVIGFPRKQINKIYLCALLFFFFIFFTLQSSYSVYKSKTPQSMPAGALLLFINYFFFTFVFLTIVTPSRRFDSALGVFIFSLRYYIANRCV